MTAALFGSTLTRLRERRPSTRARGKRRLPCLSQTELGDRIGADHSAVWRWERGQRLPDRATIDRLADALAASPGERAALLLAAGCADPGLATVAAEPLALALARYLRDATIPAERRAAVRAAVAALLEVAA